MPSPDSNWTPLASALFGGGGVIFFAKLYISRSVAKLDEICAKLESVAHKLAVLETKAEAIRGLKNLIHEHDRKIVELETRAQKHGQPRFS